MVKPDASKSQATTNFPRPRWTYNPPFVHPQGTQFREVHTHDTQDYCTSIADDVPHGTPSSGSGPDSLDADGR
jgi:hypothetical protein